MDNKEILQALEEQVSGIKDPILKKVAFERLLDNFLVTCKGKSKKAKKVQSLKSEEKKKNPTSAKKGRPGPKEILTKLVKDGYFDKPKLVTEIPPFIKHKTGHTYSQGELSITLTRLLRQGLLSRDKNEKGPYRWLKA